MTVLRWSTQKRSKSSFLASITTSVTHEDNLGSKTVLEIIKFIYTAKHGSETDLSGYGLSWTSLISSPIKSKHFPTMYILPKFPAHMFLISMSTLNRSDDPFQTLLKAVFFPVLFLEDIFVFSVEGHFFSLLLHTARSELPVQGISRAVADSLFSNAGLP